MLNVIFFFAVSIQTKLNHAINDWLNFIHWLIGKFRCGNRMQCTQVEHMHGEIPRMGWIYRHVSCVLKIYSQWKQTNLQCSNCIKTIVLDGKWRKWKRFQLTLPSATLCTAKCRKMWTRNILSMKIFSFQLCIWVHGSWVHGLVCRGDFWVKWLICPRKGELNYKGICILWVRLEFNQNMIVGHFII